jgi:hypothetical protein
MERLTNAGTAIQIGERMAAPAIFTRLRFGRVQAKRRKSGNRG